MTDLSSTNHSDGQRLLAVGGIHVFESPTPCKLERAKPRDAVKNLEWANTLALEATREGEAEVSCDGERINLSIVPPVRLQIKVTDDRKPTDIGANERFTVQALLYDKDGRELEVGKFTNFEWRRSGVIKSANDPSAGEFGFCDTCYGRQHFRAISAGHAVITAGLDDLVGKLEIEVHS